MKKRILSIVLAICMVLTLVPATVFADTASCEHSYEWQSGNGQYWQKCNICLAETAKKKIPTFTIDAPNKVCRTQDCEVSVLLPNSIPDAVLSCEFIGLGGAIDTTVENGKLYAVTEAQYYPSVENSFKLVVYATTADGFSFNVSKTVEIQNKHSGGTATCKKAAVCDTCGKSYGQPDSSNHKLAKITAKATTSKNGSVVTKCTLCGAVKSRSTIYYPKTISLSATSYTYDGKVKTPSVTVKDSKGKTLKKNTDYTVTYASGRQSVGQYAVKITFKGNYSGTKTLYFYVKPKATSISSVSAGSKKFTVKWKKQATQTTGYQIQYSTSSNFTNAKTETVGKNSTTSKTISKLLARKKYYVRVRTYKTVKINGKATNIYSSWSSAKAVTTKK
ncbi:MAG: fibronectin type III domain-containing protein [Eubacterium sp.]